MKTGANNLKTRKSVIFCLSSLKIIKEVSNQKCTPKQKTHLNKDVIRFPLT